VALKIKKLCFFNEIFAAEAFHSRGYLEIDAVDQGRFSIENNFAARI
jgi:hypothetical protein